MDANRFDTLSRQLGTTPSRRSLLRLVGALPLLGALGSLGSEPAGAQTPLDQVQDRAEQRQERNDRKDRGEQRKGKRNGDGGGDGKNDGGGDGQNDGPGLRGVSCPAGTVALANGSCAIACTWDANRQASSCPNDLGVGPPRTGPFCACQTEADGQDVCMVAPPSVEQGCRTTADCPSGYACYQPWGNVCVALCALPAA